MHEAIDVHMIFFLISQANETRYHQEKKSFAISLILKVRVL